MIAERAHMILAVVLAAIVGAAVFVLMIATLDLLDKLMMGI